MLGWIRRPAALAAIFVAVTLLLGAPARADDVADEADLQFRIGAEKYTAGDFKSALEHFLASNRLVPNRNAVFNVARTYEKLERYPESFRYYTAAIAAEPDPAAKERIGAALAQIRPHVAVISVDTDPPGATLYVDRRDLGPRGESPRALGLAPGSYTVIAELPGYYPSETQVTDARAGTTTDVRLVLRAVLGKVQIDGPSRGARVRMDDPRELPRCVVPCALDVSPGAHVVRLSLEGHRQAEIPIRVAPHLVTSVNAALEAVTGTVLVTTDEPGALITVDGRSSGFTPAILTLPVGEHSLGLTLRGFRPVIRQIAVRDDRQIQVDTALAQDEEVEAASRVAESVEKAPSSVTIVPREEIVALGYPTIAEAVRGVRGVYLWNDRAYQSMGMRGLGRLGSYNNRLLVLLDGHPTNDDWVGSAYVGYDGRTDLADVDRIEVVRGPGSVLYGTNAFSGVVNVVTRYRDERPGVEAGISTVDAGVTRGRVRGQAQLGRDSGIWTSVAGARGAGRDFFFDQGASRGSDGFAAGTVEGRVWWKWLTLQWFANSHDKQLPTGEFSTLLGDPRTHQQDTRAFLELRAEPVVSSTVQLFSRVHANLYRFRGDYAHRVVDGGLEKDTFDGQWAGAEQRVVWTPLPPLRLTLGGEGQLHYRVDATARDAAGVFLDESGTTGRPYRSGALYALADADPSDRAHLSFGARLDAYSTFGSSLNPRAALVMKPYEGGNLKILGGKAFRAPSTYELYYNDGGTTQIPSPDLRPESMYSFEVEHSHRFANTVTGLVSAWTNYVTDLIVLRGGGVETDPAHYANVSTPLLSAGLDFGLRREWRQGFMVQASYGLTRSTYLASRGFSDLVSLRKDSATRNVENTPAHLATFKAAAPVLPRILTVATRVTFESGRYDRFESRTDPEPQSRTEYAVLWDLVLSGREERYGIRYAVGAYNLGDFRYSLPTSNEFSQRSIQQNGRTFLASLDVEL